jgi:hypothetical protein
MNPETTTYAVDFESYYDADCSIKTLGPRGYFSHPNFDAYMVTVVGDNGYSYVGCPRAFDWSLLDGAVVLSHNASFDESLYLYGVEQGWFSRCAPSAWHCTADMTAFLGLPRALKNASAAVLGAEVDKSVRDNMKGKRWETMTPEFRAEVAEYALKDSELCLQLWQALQERWPARERKISALNRRIGQRGLPMDLDLLKKNLETIGLAIFEAEQAIPWTKDYTPLSRKAFNEQCRKQGITPPSSLAQDSEEADKWFAEHQQACPWARAVQSYRRINSFTRKLEAFDAGTMPDGRYYGGLMYCGANPTARFSGSGGNLNLQNLPREETFGVNFRHMIRPAEGRKLVVVDLAQIEVRTLFWWAKDQKGLEMIRQAPDIYEVIAIILGMHDPANGSLKDNKPLRQKVKAMALGCQFGLGPDGFAAYSGMSLPEATDAVNLYQSRMRTITKFWDQLREDMVMSSSLGEPLQIELPSGRVMNYGIPRKMKTVSSTGKLRFAHVGKMVRNGQLRDFRLWHGLLAENCLFEHTQVLTSERGWVSANTVTAGELVFDGEAFVRCDGWKSNGRQPVIDVYGVFATRDHRFLVNGSEWVAAEKCCALPVGQVSLPYDPSNAPHREEVWPLHSGEATPRAQETERQDHLGLGSPMRLRGEIPQADDRPQEDGVLQQAMSPVPRDTQRRAEDAREIQTPALRSVEEHGGPLPPPNPSSVGELRGSGDQSLPSLAGVIPELLGRHESHVGQGPDPRSDQQRRELLTGELPMGDSSRTGEEQTDVEVARVGGGPCGQEWSGTQHGLLSAQEGSDDGTSLCAEVGDILNCGPRNRFAVRAGEGAPVLIAHNCAQGLARDIFSEMLLRIDEAGHDIILHVHDEVVVECAAEEAEKVLAECLEIMSTPPAWIPDIPLAAEGEILNFYSK